jgi:hypothetical protein
VDQQQQSRWRPTRRQAEWGVAIGAALVLYLVAGYGFRLEWTGLVKGFPGKTIWDWLELLIVPAVLAAGGIWFNLQQREREQQVANERVQDETLQEYLDRILQMSADQRKPGREGPSRDSLSTMGRTLTLTVLPKLDGDRKARVVQFLYELGLISRSNPVIDLQDADLSKTKLDNLYLRDVNLARANLIGAYLRGADLRGSDLSYANLLRADLSPAPTYYQADVDFYFMPASLMDARLEGTRFGHAKLNSAAIQNAVLTRADLTNAELTRVNFEGAIMPGAKLKNANLTEATMPNTDLTKAHFEGTIMPNGQKYEDWIKTAEGQDWLWKYKKNLGAYRQSYGVYKSWIQTTEGQMWLTDLSPNI